MKNWIPPVVALAVAGAWVAAKQTAITRIEGETEVLRERIRVASRAGGGDGRASLAGDATRQADKDEIDWQELGESFVEMQQGGMPDMRAMMKLQQRLMAMDAAELEAALDEIEGLELSREARQALEQMLMSSLMQKEPQLMLDRFFDRLQDPQAQHSWQMAHAFRQWLGEDSAAARAWFDRHIEAGDFDSKSLDGRSENRLRFEAALLAELVGEDPREAEARLRALPEDQRAELFNQGMFMNLKPGDEMAYARLIRENLPEDQQAAALSNVTGMLVHSGDYEGVSGFLEKIDASAEERRGVATRVAQAKLQSTGRVDRATVDELREWLATEATDSVDAVTGEALGNVYNGRYGEQAKLVEELHAEGGGDDLLVGFLESGQGHSHREEALRLARMIEDREQRNRLIERFGGEVEGDEP